MPRAGARKHVIRRRFQRKRQEYLAYAVPRQGIRVRRTPAQAREEYAEAARRLGYRNRRRHPSSYTGPNARPLRRKKKSFWARLWGG